ncbi:MAG: response regulator [Chloroflexi bacterium]|nr:MAG: response regulator [Chloroflexota bacterium]
MNKRVLVVDQSKTIQILLSQYFGNAGYHVISCSTQEEALQVLGSVSEAPDLIVLTIDARKEAYKVVAYVKGCEVYAQTHLVAMVLEEEKASIQKTLSGLNISYLVKPFRLQDIHMLVSSTFNASSDQAR